MIMPWACILYNQVDKIYRERSQSCKVSTWRLCELYLHCLQALVSQFVRMVIPHLGVFPAFWRALGLGSKSSLLIRFYSCQCRLCFWHHNLTQLACTIHCLSNEVRESRAFRCPLSMSVVSANPHANAWPSAFLITLETSNTMKRKNVQMYTYQSLEAKL